MTEPLIEAAHESDGRQVVRLSGRWTLAELNARQRATSRQLEELTRQGVMWDLDGLSALDTAGAMMLWRAWGRTLPDALNASPERRAIFERIAQIDVVEQPINPRPMPGGAITRLGTRTLAVLHEMRDLLALVGQWLLGGLG